MILTQLRRRLVTTLREQALRWLLACPPGGPVTSREHHDPYESLVRCQRRLLPGLALCLSFSSCHFLDHQEAEVGLRVGPHLLGYRLCSGAERIRPSGFYLQRDPRAC